MGLAYCYPMESEERNDDLKSEICLASHMIMRYLTQIILGSLFLAIGFLSPAFAQIPKKYEPRTLAQVVQANSKSVDKVFSKAKLEERQDFIGIDPMFSAVRVQFISGSRPISASHVGLIEWWGKLQHADKKFLQQYEKEFLFKENGVEYWIPVQKQFADEIALKFKQGDPITLLVLYVGARKETNEKDYSSLFLSTGYAP